QVRFLGTPMTVPFSNSLLGRVFTGSGQPRDKGPVLHDNPIPIGGPSVNPAKRIIPKKMIRTGIPMIDVFNTLVESQKLPIFSIAGEPYNPLLARIALQAEVDVILLGGIGLKYDYYLYFRDTLDENGALGRSIHVAISVDDEPLIVYWADGVIAATATGSTAYAFSVGGPLMPPTSPAIVLAPVAPHLSFANAFVLEQDPRIDLEVKDEPARLSIDGQVERDLVSGDHVAVRRSPTAARLVRTAHARPFLALLRQKILKEPPQ
ncbi:MAG: hypothetical protein AAB295_09280, partial [Chloroflexota bacterium]